MHWLLIFLTSVNPHRHILDPHIKWCQIFLGNVTWPPSEGKHILEYEWCRYEKPDSFKGDGPFQLGLLASDHLGAEHSNTLRRVCARLSEDTGILPRSLMVDADELGIPHHPCRSGSYSDVFRASWAGTTVAIKVIRAHASTTESTSSPEKLSAVRRT